LKTEKEKMLSGELYSVLDGELVAERLHAKKMLHRFNVTEFIFGKNAALILKELLPNASKDIYIEPPFHCDYGYNIFTGKRVYVNVNCVFLDVMPITIGSNVFIGPAVQIYSATHPTDLSARRKKAFGKSVTIGNDCWIGGGAIICPGVKIGNGCVIGAGAVVTKNIADHSLVVGNPGRIIKKLL